MCTSRTGLKEKIMTEFEEAVNNMRKAQQSYFRTRDPKVLKNAKHWEKVVDQHLEKARGEALF